MLNSLQFELITRESEGDGDDMLGHAESPSQQAQGLQAGSKSHVCINAQKAVLSFADPTDDGTVSLVCRVSYVHMGCDERSYLLD